MAYFHGVKVTNGVDQTLSFPELKTNIIGIVGVSTANSTTFQKVTLVRSEADLSKLFPRFDEVKEAKESYFDTIRRSIDAVYLQGRRPLIVVYNAYKDGAAGVTGNGNDESLPTEANLKTFEPLLLDNSGAVALKDFFSLVKNASDKPKILIVPYYSHISAVKTEAIQIATKLRAVFLSDLERNETVSNILNASVTRNGPNTPVDGTLPVDRNEREGERREIVREGETASLLAASDLKASSRIFYLFPFVKAEIYPEEDLPLSPFAAGLLAKVDSQDGFWVSPSNRSLAGIVGPAKEVGFTLGDEESDAVRLNELGIATVIRINSWRLWGPRTRGAYSEDRVEKANKFLNVRRITDTIDETLMLTAYDLIDRNITRNFIEELKESVNEYFRELRRVGAILGGECFARPEDNPPQNIRDGKIVFTYEFTPSYPAESITLNSIITDRFIAEVFANG